MRRLALLALFVAGCSREPLKAGTDASTTTTRVAPSEPASHEVGSDAGAPAPRVVVAADDVDALSLVRTKRLEARAEGRTLVVYAGAEWCPPCKRFREELRTGRLDAQLGGVTLLVFDADRDAERLASAGYAFQYIPYVALPGVDGRPTDSVQATGKGAEAWRAMLGKLDVWQHGAR